jgi:predicted phosphodiesterase
MWVKDVNPQSPKTHKKIEDFITNVLKPKPADCLVIAGDIGHYNVQNMILLEKLKEIYEEVIVVNGNHCMYLVSKNIQSKYDYSSFKRVAEFKQMCKDSGINYLDGDVVEIKGVKIGGTGMWYELEESEIYEWYNVMNDSRLILNGPLERIYGGWNMYSSSTTETKPSFNPINFYKQEVKKLEGLKDIDVFVSHVIPVPIPDEARDDRYKNDKYNKFYESNNLEKLQATGAKYSIFGHTHIEADFTLGGIRFLASAIGYPQENSYREIKVLEI